MIRTINSKKFPTSAYHWTEVLFLTVFLVSIYKLTVEFYLFKHVLLYKICIWILSDPDPNIKGLIRFGSFKTFGSFRIQISNNVGSHQKVYELFYRTKEVASLSNPYEPKYPWLKFLYYAWAVRPLSQRQDR